MQFPWSGKDLKEISSRIDNKVVSLNVSGFVINREKLLTARKLTAMLLPEGSGQERRDERILVFYPGCAPDSALLAA